MTPHTLQEPPTEGAPTYASITDICQALHIPNTIVQWLILDFQAFNTLNDLRYVA